MDVTLFRVMASYNSETKIKKKCYLKMKVILCTISSALIAVHSALFSVFKSLSEMK